MRCCLLFLFSWLCVPPAFGKLVGPQVPLRVGQALFSVQLAATPQARGEGLKHQLFLPKDSGVLFIFQQINRVSFYMADTPIALDIGFFNAEGRLLEVYSMRPFDRTAIVSKSREVKYALELSKGIFKLRGIDLGARLKNIQFVEKSASLFGARPLKPFLFFKASKH